MLYEFVIFVATMVASAAMYVCVLGDGVETANGEDGK